MKYSWTFLFVAVLAITTNVLFGQQIKRALTPDNIVQIREVSDPRISPDNKWVAFVVTEPGDTSKPGEPRNSDIWIVPSNASSPPRKYAFSSKQELMPRWSPDGIYLAFLSNRGEKGKNQIYLLPTVGGEAEPLTLMQSGVEQFKWLSNSIAIAFTSTDSSTEEEEQEQKAKDDERVVDEDYKYVRLYEIDLSTRNVESISTGNENVFDFDLSPDGKRYVLHASLTPKLDDIYFNARLVVINRGDASRTVISEKSYGNVRWSPDGNQILFSSFTGEATVSFPMLISPTGSRIKTLLEEYKGTVEEMEWLSSSNSILVAAQEGTQGTIGRLDISSNTVRRLKTVGRGSYESLWWSKSIDGSLIAFTHATDSSPPDIWIMKSDGLNSRRLTTLNPQVDSLTFGEIRSIQWKSRDGISIEGILVFPVGYVHGIRYPLVVRIHGGPSWHWSVGWLGLAQLLANNGYAVLLPNIRGSTGYGGKFEASNFNDWGGGDFEDLMSGVDYLIREGIADSERLGIGGPSYGGYMTAWTVSQTNRFKAAVMSAGLSNLISFYGTTDIPTFMKLYFGGHPFDRKQAYERHSPLTYVKHIRTPTLIIHGKEDLRVPILQSYEFYQGLRDIGTEARLVIYPREGHGIEERAHLEDLFQRVLNWYDKYVKVK